MLFLHGLGLDRLFALEDDINLWGSLQSQNGVTQVGMDMFE